MGQSKSTPQPFYTEEEKQKIYKQNPWLGGIAAAWMVKKAKEDENPLVKTITVPVEELGTHTANASQHAWSAFWGLFGLAEKGAELADSGVNAVGEGISGATWLLDHHILLYAVGAFVAYQVLKRRQ